ncbi:SprT family zinc-dependent metalloprotease [Aliagarivorans taiwanensis]|uniref:SprT family zinc-dependent metalloprotease n=1 Tax=Aliagarivorans taiwanensis TaxID=561966 RepID=UPI0003F81C1F|nr:SprT family zinc-dependent metalloprotease [Aliagarivorans taiwanensis]
MTPSSQQLNAQLYDQLNQKVEHYFQLAEAFFKRNYPRPEVVLSARRSKVAGSANCSHWRLRFNQHFYQQQPEQFLAQTVPHEVAHLICHAEFGRVAPHGKQWQAVMQTVFNCPPQRTHSFDTTAVSGQQFDYRCGCQQHKLSIRRHNKVLRGAQYACRRCGELLKPHG